VSCVISSLNHTDLHDRSMAKDELETISEDKWDEDIWGIEHADAESRKEIPKLKFYFGEHVSLRIIL
jgi:hypothetical protein